MQVLNAVAAEVQLLQGERHRVQAVQAGEDTAVEDEALEGGEGWEARYLADGNQAVAHSGQLFNLPRRRVFVHIQLHQRQVAQRHGDTRLAKARRDDVSKCGGPPRRVHAPAMADDDMDVDLEAGDDGAGPSTKPADFQLNLSGPSPSSRHAPHSQLASCAHPAALPRSSSRLLSPQTQTSPASSPSSAACLLGTAPR